MSTKNYFIGLILFLIASTVQSQKVEYVFHSVPFYIPGKGPFIETYSSFFGRSVQFVKGENRMKQAKIGITLLIIKDTSIVGFRKYILNSPAIPDTATVFPNFVDIQRIALDSGVYYLQYFAYDINDTIKKPVEVRQLVDCQFNNGVPFFSGIETIELFSEISQQNILTKSGYELIPYVASFYPSSMNKITFYCELYHTDSALSKGADFIISYYIENAATRQKNTRIGRLQKQKADQVNVVLASLDISQLPSGNYSLVVEARSRENQLLAKTNYFFQRSSPMPEISLADLAKVNQIPDEFKPFITNSDSLKEYIQATYPISNYNERKYAANLIAGGDIQLMQNYFYSFWLARNNENPFEEWKIYNREVRKVNSLYSLPFKKGYESDRGRVYLQYGPPNTVYTSKMEPSAYPYEIWHYYSLPGQNDVKFVFYNPNIAGNDFSLLHSNAKGEISNGNWMNILKSRFRQLQNYRTGIIDSYTDYGEHIESEFYGIDIDTDNQIRSREKR